MRRAATLTCALLCFSCTQTIRTRDAGSDQNGNGGGDPADAGTPPGVDSGIGATDGGDADGNCATDWRSAVLVESPLGDGGFRDVRALAFDAARNLYVLSRNNNTGYVTVLSPAPDHRLLRVIGAGQMTRVTDLAFDADGNLYVTEAARGDPSRVYIYGADGQLIDQWDVEQQQEAESIVIDPQGRVLIGDLAFARHTRAGAFIDFVGRWGMAVGRVGRANDLAVDDQGFVWIADLARNRVHQFDPEAAQQVAEYGGRGVGPATFDQGAEDDVRWGPWRLAIDGVGNIYANDPFVSRMVKLSRRGEFLGDYGFGGSREIGPIAVEPQTGSVYVGRGSSVDIVCPL